MERERPDSLLTDTQRRYLRGKTDELSDDAERMKRRRIRNRLKAGIEDFDVVLNHLEPGERTQITDFDHLSEPIPDDRKEELQDSQAFAEGLMSMVAFAAQCADDMDNAEPEDLFQASLRRYAERTPQVDTVDVEVTVNRRTIDLFGDPGLDRLQEQFEARQDLSLTEIQMLLDRERIDREDVDEYLDDMIDGEADLEPAAQG